MKYQLRKNRLSPMRMQAFADRQPAFRGERFSGFAQAENKIVGDVHHVHAKHQVELILKRSLSAPRAIDIERFEFERQLWKTAAEHALRATPKERARLCDDVALHAIDEFPLTEDAEQQFARASGAGADFENAKSALVGEALRRGEDSHPVVHGVARILVVEIGEPQPDILGIEQ